MSNLPFWTTPATNPGNPSSKAVFLICACKDRASFDSPKIEGEAAKHGRTDGEASPQTFGLPPHRSDELRGHAAD
jgi:hypothetical protein